MKVHHLLLPWLLVLAFFSAPVQAAYLNRQDYVPVSQWARDHGYHQVSGDGSDTVIYAKYATTVRFEKNSPIAEINGVNVTLSFPVAADKGQFLIAQMDLDTTVAPLVFPSITKNKRITTIAIDPGHGGKDSGNRYQGHFEKTYTLPLAIDLSRALQAAGFKTILTRTKDVYVGLDDRPALANRDHADLFVSLHFNATTTSRSTVSGPETYCITPVGASSSNSQGRGANYGWTPGNAEQNESLLLAYEVEKSLVKNLHVTDRGVRRARFAVLRGAKMPAILVESGYMTNPTEGKKIYSVAYRKQIAAAITQAILSYQKLTEPVPRKISKEKGHR